MAQRDHDVISAQVILRPAGGQRVENAADVRAETIGRYQPSADSVAAVRQAFASAGFQVGPVVGNSVSITAPVSTFETFFKIRLRRQDWGAVQIADASAGDEFTLPLDALPPPLPEHVAGVIFTPPLAFGPTNP
jgi:hypothetical protein